MQVFLYGRPPERSHRLGGLRISGPAGQGALHSFEDAEPKGAQVNNEELKELDADEQERRKKTADELGEILEGMVEDKLEAMIEKAVLKRTATLEKIMAQLALAYITLQIGNKQSGEMAKEIGNLLEIPTVRVAFRSGLQKVEDNLNPGTLRIVPQPEGGEPN